MNAQPEEFLTYQKHVHCFDKKVDLMKCLTRLKKQRRQLEEGRS